VQDLTMNSAVDIGLCVTSHQAGVVTIAQFSNVTTTGTVGAAWQVADVTINHGGQDAAGLYASVQDSTGGGKGKFFQNSDPAATCVIQWTPWNIPLSELAAAGVKTTKVQKITLGAGNRASPAAGGTGTLYLDDIGFGHSAK
jgi:hypothetical protein